MRETQEFVRKYISHIAWTIAIITTLIAVTSWGQNHNWKIIGLGSYEIFPLFGLLAFTLMWGHYIVGGIKSALNIEDAKIHKSYFKITSWIVLASLLLHPSLLIWQLYADGLGLPPKSYVENYIAPGLAWAVYLGSISWLIFMAFELRRFYSKKKWWKYVLYANDAAIIAVFIHSYKLGADVSDGWLHNVWIFYGFTLVIALGAKYYRKWFAKPNL